MDDGRWTIASIVHRLSSIVHRLLSIVLLSQVIFAERDQCAMILERFLNSGQKAAAKEEAIRRRVPVRVIAGLPAMTAIMFIVLFVVAFYAYSVLWRSAPLHGGDTTSYLEVAQDIKDFSVDQPHFRTVGYPILMVLTGSTVDGTKLLFFVQLLMNLASIWLLACILYAAGVSTLLVRLFGLVLLLPPYMESAAYVLTEALTQLLLVIGLAGIAFWYQNRNTKWLVASAVAIAYSAITRPANQILAFAMVACLFAMPSLVHHARVTRRDVKKASMILASATIALVGAYSLMNFAKFHYAGITYSLGYNLGTRTVRVLERLPDEYAPVRDAMIRIRDAQLVEPNSSHTGYQFINTIAFGSGRDELEKITGLKPPEFSNYLVRLNLRLIGAAPLEYLQEVAWGMASYWFPSARDVSSFRFTDKTTGKTTGVPSGIASGLHLGWAALHFVFLGIFVLQFVTFLGLALLSKSKRIVWGRKGITPDDARPNLHSLSVLAYTLAGTMVFLTMILTCTIDVGQPRQRTSTESLFIFMIFLGASIWGRLIKPAQTQVHSADAAEERQKVEAWLHKKEQEEAEVEQVHASPKEAPEVAQVQATLTEETEPPPVKQTRRKPKRAAQAAEPTEAAGPLEPIKSIEATS